MSRGISVECEGFVSDDEIVDHVTENAALLRRILSEAAVGPGANSEVWGESFPSFDAIDRQRAADLLISRHPDYFASPSPRGGSLPASAGTAVVENPAPQAGHQQPLPVCGVEQGATAPAVGPS